jgi:hypothetical protein
MFCRHIFTNDNQFRFHGIDHDLHNLEIKTIWKFERSIWLFITFNEKFIIRKYLINKFNKKKLIIINK